MLIKILWSIVATSTFTLGIMSLIMMLVYASGDESLFAIISLASAILGIGFAIHLLDKEVL